MSILDLMPTRYQRWFHMYRHNHTVVDILTSPALRQANTGLMFLSMLRHSDVLMYLVAIKPIYNHLGPGLITIINDGSLSADDRQVLDSHLGGVRFLSIDQVDTQCCPRGGTWERLLSVLDFSLERYVIQVDADIVALGDLSEVADCIRENRAFTLAGDRIALVEDADEASARVKRMWADGDATSVQPIAEQLLHEMPGAASLRYIWGTSAFAGFPRGGGGRETASTFSIWMEGRLGRLWHDWGSEQVTSNFVIANAPNPMVLPWDKYQCYQPPGFTLGTDLNHFYGTYRFVGNAYQEQSRRAISKLCG